MMRWVAYRSVLLALMLTALPAAAQPRPEPLPPPRGPVILTVSGAIAVTNAPGEARFDMAMIEALPQSELTTTTPWNKEPARFQGPLLRDLLARLGAAGTSLTMTALNDYNVRIPAGDARDYGVVLAIRRDGQPMPVRDKGPIWVIYPFDAEPSLNNERVYGRCIWQLARIQIE